MLPIPSPTRSVPALLPALVLAAAFTHACAAQESARSPWFAQRILIDRELKSRAVKMVGLDASSISILDVGGLIRSEPADKYLAIITPGPVTQAIALDDRAATIGAAEIPGFLPWSPGEPDRVDLLTLVDGQRLTGHPDGREAAPDQFITWTHPSFGPLRVSLESVKRIDVGPASVFSLPAGAASRNDLLLLANGDQMEGFVAAATDPLLVEINKKAMSLPWSRVKSVLFAAPVQRPSGAMVWLADGTVLRVSSITSAPGKRVRLVPALASGAASEHPGDAPSISVSFAALAAIAFESMAIVPLSGLPVADIAGQTGDISPVARVDAGLDQPLFAGTIEFARPGTAAWQLPAGAARLAFHAELPPDCWSWGDCELVLSVNTPGGPSTELARQHLSAEHSEAEINVPIDAPAGSTLVIRVDEGAYGPIQDRVILRRGLLRVTPALAAPAR